MKHNLRSFSFLMEFVFMIFFFALASCVCVGLLAKAKEKETIALTLQHDLLQAQSMIEELQTSSVTSVAKQFQWEKQDAESFKKDNLLIYLHDGDSKQGYILLQDKGVGIAKLPFVAGGE